MVSLEVVPAVAGLQNGSVPGAGQARAGLPAHLGPRASSGVEGVPGLLSRFRAVLARRDTLALLVNRDLKVKYSTSRLGYVWSVLDPLLMSGVYWFVFTQIFSRGVGREPYLVFLLLGILPWQWANGVIRDASRALTADAKLVRSTNLPREIWILRVVGTKAVEFLLSIPVLILFVLIYRQEPSWYLAAFPLAALIQVVFLVGIGLLLAPLTVLYTDLRRLLRVALRVMFYLSPIIYGVRDVQANAPEWVQTLYVLNPMAGILDLYRAAFFPGFFAGWTEVVVAAVVSTLVFVLGVTVFVRLEGRVLKEI
jgi:ABC-2 type transport system permease protein